MSIKSRNKRIVIYLMVVATCIVVTGLWATLLIPEAALAKKPPDKPGGGGEVGQKIPVCIVFDEVSSINTDGDDPYCDGDLKKKVTAFVGRAFSIFLTPNNSNKTTAGRTLWLDLSVALGENGSINVDVSDGAGGNSDGICDEYIDGVPDMPTERFGTLPSGQKFGYPDNARLEIWGRDLDGLRVGNTVETNARLYFSVGGQSWVLHWGSFEAPGGRTYAPGTAPVTVYRYDNDTWQITNLTGDACLYRSNNPPHSATEYHGQVIVPFAMTAVAINPEEDPWGDEPWDIIPGNETPCQEIVP
ncbi:MAG: hypothetical protein ACYSUX_06105 [Planctomycetota bacterium]|jgi:hypothetical protein